MQPLSSVFTQANVSGWLYARLSGSDTHLDVLGHAAISVVGHWKGVLYVNDVTNACGVCGEGAGWGGAMVEGVEAVAF